MAMGIDEFLIQEIVRRILSVARPDKIILFGSAATGAMTSDSDIDLLIVEPKQGNRRAEYVRIRRALKGLGHSFDIILIPTPWFEESKAVIGGIAYPADKQGKVIYGAA
jgi:predicted nucleotidyltransferase